ncbi:hypothetical protein AB6A40_010276 [Gnathostoma spinigerum]|uniref:Uncharacterized protein n=1 Tax=Gnathostoma spinigerum TaxID=75299 RepID=A0ABD6F259_9BILA
MASKDERKVLTAQKKKKRKNKKKPEQVWKRAKIDGVSKDCTSDDTIAYGSYDYTPRRFQTAAKPKQSLSTITADATDCPVINKMYVCYWPTLLCSEGMQEGRTKEHTVRCVPLAEYR